MANQSFLSLAQAFCREYGLPVPGALQGGDTGALQLREALANCGEDLWGRTNWQACCIRATWTSVAGEDQGDIFTLFPENFDSIVPRTFWDYTAQQQIGGPLSDENWQIHKSINPTGPLYYYKVVEDRLLVSDTMPVDHDLTLYYKSKNWIRGASGLTNIIAADSDTSIFADRVMKAGLRAYWLRLKQMPHRLEWQLYDDMAAAEAAKNTVRPILHMDSGGSDTRPRIAIPLGNWTVS